MSARRPTLHLTVGLPSTGKTTAARRIEVQRGALRLTKDEWVKALYGRENPPGAQDVIEGRLVEVGLRVLQLGVDVVIDYGLWSRDERSALRQAAADLGAAVELHYFEATPEEQRRRADQRQADAPHTTWPMSDEELAGCRRLEAGRPPSRDGGRPARRRRAGMPGMRDASERARQSGVSGPGALSGWAIGGSSCHLGGMRNRSRGWCS